MPRFPVRFPGRTTRPLISLAALLVAFPVGLGAQRQATPSPPVAAARAAFDAARLARLDTLLNQYVDSSRIGGAVALVLRDGRVVYERAVGWSDRESSRRMTPDGIFRIASQSKAITSVAILMLVEEGRIALGDPVSRYIPTFAKTTVISRADSGRTTAPARRAINIRDLLTHTAGISYGTDPILAPRYGAKGLGPAAGFGWYTADKAEPICTTMDTLGTLPFAAQPGEGFTYGYATDILGCVVERASGVPLDAFIRTRITGPLKMTDTHFFLPTAKRSRLATVYASDSSGGIARAPDGPRGQGDYVEGARTSFSGGAGMLSTARDYARFLQMLLDRGELDGVRILSPRMVDLMTTDQIGTLYSPAGMGFGLGFEITETLGANGLTSPATFGWGGAYGSTYKVDPAERLVMVFMLNQVPNRTDIASKFPTLVYQALTDVKPPKRD